MRKEENAVYISIGSDVVLRIEEILSFVNLDLAHDRKKYNNAAMLMKAAERGDLYDLAAEAGRDGPGTLIVTVDNRVYISPFSIGTLVARCVNFELSEGLTISDG